MSTPSPCRKALAGCEGPVLGALALFAGLGGFPLVPAHGQQSTAREPARHALLVGCGEYPELRKAFPERYERELALRGPVNDVELLRRTLELVLGLAPERTAVLAGWGEDVRGRPTRANVLGHLERLAREAGPGDQVIVYLAGHGSQQGVRRMKPGEEPDMLEELFLPADVRPAEKEQDHVPNSIRDDELGERVRAIRDRGADVWLIVDSCHSGTMLRGGQADVRLRGLDPALLGAVPATRGGRPGSAPSGGGGWLDGADTTRIAALYGATSYGRAPEMELPRATAGARPHGLFTYLLCQELQRVGPRASYRELSERVIAAYQAFPCVITVPTAEGDLGRELGSGLSVEAPLVCTLRSGVPFLNQGRLAGLEPGVEAQLFELVQGEERSVGRIEITGAELFEARARVLEGELAPESGPWRARADARPLGDYRLGLALVHADGSVAASTELPAGLRTELERRAASFPILADPGAADWCVVLAPGGGIWLRPGPREGGFDVCDVPPERLLETLAAIQKTRNLRRFAGSAFTADWRGDLDVWVERHGSRGWQRLEHDGVLRPGQKVRVLLKKSSDAIYDVNVYFLDANFGSLLLEPKSGSPRLAPEAREALDLTGELTITDDALGLENLLVFATPRTSASPVIDLRMLEQKSVTRGAPPDPFEDLLRSVLAGQNTRGEPVRTAGARGTQSLLTTLRTDWGELAPPPWPARSIALARPPRAAGAGDRQELGVGASAPAPEAPPDPWECGSRAALARSPGSRAGCDLLLLGEAEVEAVLVDFDEGAAADADPARLVRERAFDAEAAFLFGPRRLAFYDRAEPAGFDLALADADADGVAEVRWVLEGERWRRDAPVALPWLSQAYVHLGQRKKAEVSGRLQALQRAE